MKKKNVDAWIARDKNGFLAIYFHKKPILIGDSEWLQFDLGHSWAVLDRESYPDVTFENSPIKVTITKP